MSEPADDAHVDVEVRRAALSLIAAELDGQALDIAPALLDHADRAFLIALAAHMAEVHCNDLIRVEDDRTEEVRAQIQAELLRLAE